MATAAVRHANLSGTELDDILLELDSKNTKIANNHSVSVFKDYIGSKFGYGERAMETFTAATLDEALTTFYAEVRTQKGELVFE